MKENRDAYEDLADRAVRLLAAVANAVSKANQEKLRGMEGNVARLLLCVLDRTHLHTHSRLTRPSSALQEIKSATESRLATSSSTGKLDSMKKLLRSKGKDALRTSTDQEEIQKLGRQLDRAVEEFDVRSL
jgi:hypothetical protein